MSSRVTHADRTAPRIERRKSCPRRSRRGGPHSGKKAERTSSTGAKTRREWNGEKTANAPEFLPRPLHLFFSLLPQPVLLFFLSRSLAISHQGTMICICVEQGGKERESPRVIWGSGGPRKQIRTGAGASEHRPTGLSLRTKKMQTNGEARRPLSADGVCGTEARKPFNLFARLNAFLWERRIQETKKETRLARQR